LDSRRSFLEVECWRHIDGRRPLGQKTRRAAFGLVVDSDRRRRGLIIALLRVSLGLF
jgi:hypothetical protein